MPEWLLKISKNPFLTNSLLFTVVFGVTNFINFLANFIIVKGLPVEWYGEYSSAVAYVNLLSISLSIISLIIIKKIGLEKAAARQKFIALTEKRLLMTFQQYWWLVVTAILGLAVWLYGWSNFQNQWSIVFVVLNWPVAIMSAIYASFLQGQKKFKYLGIANVIGASLKVGGAWLVVWLAPSLPGVLAAVLIGNLAVLIYQRIVALPKRQRSAEGKLVGGKAAGDKSLWQLAKSYDLGRLMWQTEIWLPTITTIGVMALVNSDQILVKMLMPEMTAGYFGVVSLLARTVYYALIPFTQVFFAFGSSQENFKHQHKNLMVATIFFMIAGGAAATVYALLPNLTLRLFATNEYLGLAPILWWAGLIGTFFALANLYSQHFIARNEKRAALAILAAIAQVALIVIYHQSLEQVLMIDLMVTGILTAIYMLFFWGKKRKNAA